MEVKLVVVGGVHAGKEIPVRRARFIIGRSKECQLRPGCNLVSRRHCAILREGGRIVVEDLGSTNGTFVNGSRIDSPHPLSHGDRLDVGSMKFEVCWVEKGAKGAKNANAPAIPETDTSSLSATPTRGGLPEDYSTEDEDGGLHFDDSGDADGVGLKEQADRVETKKKEIKEKKVEKKKEEKDELDISNWFDDEIEIGDSSIDAAGESALSSLSSEKLPETKTMPPKKKREEAPPPKTVEPSGRNAQPTPKKKDSSQTAANDMLDMLNKFVPKR